MTRSMDDLLNTADSIIEWLLGTEVTEEDIATALEQSCPDWSEKDRKDVLALAARIAYRVADVSFDACGELHERLAYPVHYMYVAEELFTREGLRPRVSDPVDRRRSMIDRHLGYPLRGYPRRDQAQTA